MSKKSLLAVTAGEWNSQKIISLGPGVGVSGAAAGAASIAVPYPPLAASVAANCITFIIVALKPGTANLGSVATPAGWTKIIDFIGGGYGGTLGVDTGNSRVYLFEKRGDNAIAGTVTVNLTPDGANGVASGIMQRIEKRRNAGVWQPVVTATGEAILNTNVGSYIPSALKATKGDCLIYGFGQSDNFVGGTALNAGPSADITPWVPSLAANSGSSNGFGISVVCTGRRLKRGITLGEQLHTIPVGANCRGPMIVARYRVR